MMPYSNIDRDEDLEHVVLWNGTRQAESGTAYLAAVEEARQPAGHPEAAEG